MTSVKEQLEARAAAWIEQERDQIALLHEWETLHAMYWLWSEGAKREGYSKNLEEFVKACKLAVGQTRINHLICQRDYCTKCGVTFKVENLSLCRCGNLYCYKCIGSRGVNPNGNRSCSCGGEIVG